MAGMELAFAKFVNRKEGFTRMKSATTCMREYLCKGCGYVYSPSLGDAKSGVEDGTAFADLPDGWVCPACGVGKDGFSPE